MENQVENLMQKVQAVEETLHVMVKELASDYAKIRTHLDEQKEQLVLDRETTQKIINIHNENREALELAQKLNESHYSAQDFIKEQTEVLKNAFQIVYSGFCKEMQLIDKKINEIPESFEIKNHHHIEPRSKGLLIILILLLFTSIVGLGFGIGNYYENQSLTANNIKYRMFRHQLPELNIKIDSIFYADPDRAALVISKLEAETELRMAAEKKRQEAEIVAKEAEELQRKEKSTY